MTLSEMLYSAYIEIKYQCKINVFRNVALEYILIIFTHKVHAKHVYIQRTVFHMLSQCIKIPCGHVITSCCLVPSLTHA